MTPLRVAFCAFTVLPVPTGSGHQLERDQMLKAMPWLPAVGVAVGGAAGAAYMAVAWLAPGPPGALLGAVLAVAVSGLLTGFLHLDGLADTADGLGSRLPAERALDVMRKSDVGPMGVATLVLALLVQVAALTVVGSTASPAFVAGGLVLAAVVARTAVVLAAVRGVSGARGEGFGALVVDGVPRRTCTLLVASLIIVAAAAGVLLGGWRAGCVLAGGSVSGLIAAAWVRRLAQRRFGGMTGDIFGAIGEAAMTVALLTLALTVSQV